MIDDLEEVESGGEEKELYEHHNIKVEKGQVMMRIDKFLMIRIQNATRTKLQQACDADCILVNGKPIKSSYKIKPLSERINNTGVTKLGLSSPNSNEIAWRVSCIATSRG